jgi:hypothetical protein
VANNILVDTFKTGLMGINSGQTFDLDTSSYKVFLVNSTGQGVADATKQGYTFRSSADGNEITGTGYSAGGTALVSPVVAIASHVANWDSADPSWATATITAYGAWVYKSLGGSDTADPLVGYWDFPGAPITSTAGTFAIQVNASGWLTLT